MNKKDLQLYYINDNYITYLKNSGNSHVEDNYVNAGTKNQKPYIGVVLRINDYNYFAPLSSPKPKLERINNDTLFKIITNDKNSRCLGIVKLINMIPVPDSALSLVDFSKLDQNYKNLLLKQLKIMKGRENLNEILRKADVVYKGVANKIKLYCSLANDFSKLENDCKQYVLQYQSQNKSQKEELSQSKFLKDWADFRNGITKGNAIQETEKHDVSEKNALSQTNSQIETTTAKKTPRIKR